MSPEFSHGDISPSSDLKFVEYARIVGLVVEEKSVLVAKFTHVGEVIVGEKIGAGPSEIPHEPFGGFFGADILSDEGGKI